jgi:4-oxalocrotonate tautomerase
MPIVNIQLLQGREPQLKESLIHAVTATIVEVLKVKPETVRVILLEYPPEHWGIAGVSVKERNK